MMMVRRTHDGTSYAAETSLTDHDHRHSVVLSHLTDHFTRLVAALRLDEATYLNIDKTQYTYRVI